MKVYTCTRVYMTFDGGVYLTYMHTEAVGCDEGAIFRTNYRDIEFANSNICENERKHQIISLEHQPCAQH